MEIFGQDRFFLKKKGSYVRVEHSGIVTTVRKWSFPDYFRPPTSFLLQILCLCKLTKAPYATSKMFMQTFAPDPGSIIKNYPWTWMMWLWLLRMVMLTQRRGPQPTCSTGKWGGECVLDVLANVILEVDVNVIDPLESSHIHWALWVCFFIHQMQSWSEDGNS